MHDPMSSDEWSAVKARWRSALRGNPVPAVRAPSCNVMYVTVPNWRSKSLHLLDLREI